MTDSVSNDPRNRNLPKLFAMPIVRHSRLLPVSIPTIVLGIVCATAGSASTAGAEQGLVTIAAQKAELGRFEESALAFSNRRYVFENIPACLQGLTFTRLPGGEAAFLRIESRPAEADVYAITSAAAVAPDDWDRVPADGFCYTDANRTPLAVYRLSPKVLPCVVRQLGWTGTMIAAAHIRLVEGVPRPDLSRVPGVVIDHQPAASRLYIGSPSIAKLEDGTYVASHDLFGPGEGAQCTLVFCSTDKGRTWERIARIPDQFWSTLFTHRGALYLIGTGGQYGPAVIRRSTDGGYTWTEPRDEKTGLLDDSARYHCAPVPVIEHAGRLWRGMEDAMGGGGWGAHFRALMMSVPVEVDLLDARNWTFSERLPRNPEWLNGEFGGWLEGNAVVTPEGEIVDILRVHRRPQGNTAAMIHIGPDGRTARFDPSRDFISFPGGAKKFTIRYDRASGRYWSLVNTLPENYDGGEPDRVRNTLALVSSPDLRTWTVRATILHHPETKYHGFQYVDWLLEDDDIIAVSRTAYDDGLGGAHNYHDANFMTFHRIERFRDR
ncbi:hypothetical protein JCM19992_05730 [Thermostilla marina]